METMISSAAKNVVIGDDRPTVLIGERINPAGKKKMSEALKTGNLEIVRKEAMAQAEAGVDIIDVCVSTFGVDEVTLLPEAVDQMISQMRNSPFPQSPEAFSRQADATKTFDALDRLGGVSVPIMVLVGDQDILMPPWAASELAAAIPGAKLKILEGGGHGFIWEVPDKVNQAVIEFLKT